MCTAFTRRLNNRVGVHALACLLLGNIFRSERREDKIAFPAYFGNDDALAFGPVAQRLEQPRTLSGLVFGSNFENNFFVVENPSYF
jgi:hypothetical protein